LYKIYLNEVESAYEMNEMIRMFLPRHCYELLEVDPLSVMSDLKDEKDVIIRIPDGIREKNDGKRYIFEALSKITGRKPHWGILTGVRPVKLTGEMILKSGSFQGTRKLLEESYLVSHEKTELLLDVYKVQQGIARERDPEAVGLYIGIPFCPSRCLYCSFPSYTAKPGDMESYMVALLREIKYVSQRMRKTNLYPETIYIGGGTPTTLNEGRLNLLLNTVLSGFDVNKTVELTVEAGRPDTITEEKLEVLKDYGVKRISINPQSMNSKTLAVIGRDHSPQDIDDAFVLARKAGISIINGDLIAGLPGESPEDFSYSLERILKFRPENITLHTLAVKRASRLKEMDEEYSYSKGEEVGYMLNRGRERLNAMGYRPYYLYRQKQMAGNFENVGYALPGTENLYNIRTMEEDQTIIALGAGGMSKIWYPGENRLERVPNVSNYEIYIKRIDEMLQRKEMNIFSNYPIK
jgi:coproporphyrinogen dehydrogenase HemZ